MHGKLKTTPGGRRLLLVAVPAAAALLVLAGCGDKSAPKAVASSNPPPSPSASVDTAKAAAAKSVVTAYNGYRQAYVVATATGDFNPDLRNYVADPLLTQLRANLLTLQQAGVVYKGKPSWNPYVTAINVTKKPYTAEISDCFDATGWDAVRKDNGQPAPAPSTQAKKYLVTASATQYDDGRWLITDAKADRSRPC